MNYASFNAMLGRASVRASLPVHVLDCTRRMQGRRVLVTGAGGSIGSELVKQIARLRADHITLVDSCEVNLYGIDWALHQMRSTTNWNACLCDIRDQDAVRHLLLREAPDIVFHAAALKHVPLLESEHNIIEAVLTNVLGTKFVCELCATHGIDFVLVSTDKAVRPSSAMGLTKRAAEIKVHEIALRYPEVNIAQVRFGNVLGSSGSVLPLFERQIQTGGPVTVTHPEMKRYLMSIDEAASLTIAAASLERQGYCIYVLEMGDPVSILELAEGMIRSAGLQPWIDIPICFIGIRPGEKLEEQLNYPWETLAPTALEGVRIARPEFDPRARAKEIDNLLIGASCRDPVRVMSALKRVVPEHERDALHVDQGVIAFHAPERAAAAELRLQASA